MLIRIRRLAGSVVGAAFILLIALSMLQMGELVNPLSFFQPSPTILEVGDQKQRWDSLSATSNGSSAFRNQSASYQEQPYGSILTAMAVQDSFNDVNVSPSSELISVLAQRVQDTATGRTLPGFDHVLERMTPLATAQAALNHQIDDASKLLPSSLSTVPLAQASQIYDFELVRIVFDTDSIPEPDDAALQAFLDENQERFQRPPTWSIDAIILEDTAIAAATEVTPDQVLQYYNENPSEFEQPETYELVTITFASQLEANLFKSQIDQGTPVDTALSGSTGTLSGENARTIAQLTEEELINAQNLDVGEVGVLYDNPEGSPSFDYLRAHNLAVQDSFEDAQVDAQRALRLQIAQSTLSEKALTLQRAARGNGGDLATLAQENGYEVQTFDELQSATSAPAPINSDALFSSLERVTNASDRVFKTTLITNSSEMVYKVTAFEEQRDLTLDEGREQIDFAWRLQQGQMAALEKANTAATDLENGTSGADIVEQLGVNIASLESLSDLSRLAQLQAEDGSANFVSTLDEIALARFSGQRISRFQQSVLGLNPDLISPFAMQDGEARVIDLGNAYQVILATKTGTEEGEIRDALKALVVDTSAIDLFQAATLRTFLDDVADGRSFKIDEQAILDQRAFEREQERRAQAASGGAHGG